MVSIAGIIIGRGDNTFDPNVTITREEAVIMIDRSLKYAGIKAKPVELPFVDKDSVYAKEELQRVYGYGIVKGDEHNQFAPKGSAQRAHAAAFINRMLKCIESN